MFLPDSNIFIRAFQNYEPEAKFLKKIILERKLMISIVIIAEFLAKSTNDQQMNFDLLTKEFKIIEINEEIARVAGEYRKQVLRKTKKTFLPDCFLAAQAKVYDLTLVTNNKADFPMEDIKIISP